MADLLPAQYEQLLTEIKERIRSAQYEALRAVNQELIRLYWDIGRLIVEKQNGDSYGRSIVKQLSKDLHREFPGISGFSERNLWYARTFFKLYQHNEKLQPMVRELGWSHNLVILDKCNDHLEREFYIRMTRHHGWTKNVLALQIDNGAYQKTLLNQTNFETTLPAPLSKQAKLAVKDEYTFDFLELGDEHSERQLETAILGKVEPFLLEMGGLLAFVGSQYRLEIDGQEFFIDLLLYHRKLRCLVALELKIGPFMPEYAGKMQFYLAALDDLERQQGENPPIGIILCRSKSKTIVEYALRDLNRPIGVSTYRVTDELPQELKGQLPEPERIAQLLEHL